MRIGKTAFSTPSTTLHPTIEYVETPTKRSGSISIDGATHKARNAVTISVASALLWLDTLKPSISTNSKIMGINAMTTFILLMF